MKDHWNIFDGFPETDMTLKEFGLMGGAALIVALAIFGLMNIF